MSALSILAEECELLNEPKYRSYITQVDKALKSFEYTSEWADLISALGKLNKVSLVTFYFFRCTLSKMCASRYFSSNYVCFGSKSLYKSYMIMTIKLGYMYDRYLK